MNNSLNVGVITGGNNNFNQHNHFHQKNDHNNGGGNKPSGGDDPVSTAIGTALAILAVTVVIAVSYLNHYDAIFFWLKLGIIVSGTLHMLALWPQYEDPDYRGQDSIPQACGIGLMALLAWLTIMTSTTLPGEVFSIAAQPPAIRGLVPQAWEVWGRFSSTGHRLILENLASTLFLAIGILSNVALGVQQLFESLGRAYQHPPCSALGHWLRFFKASAILAAACATLGSGLTISGLLSTIIS